MITPSVVVSNGFNRFHLALAAAEASRRGALALLMTGVYPTPRVRAFAHATGLARTRRGARLLDRGAAVPPNRVRQFGGSEAVHFAASALPRPFGAHLDARSFRLYARRAARIVADSRLHAQVYHYRSGFGHQSVEIAKERGMAVLCDHSIAHPSVLERLVEDGGTLPTAPGGRPRSPLWRDVLADIDRADHVVVNSNFVRETFLLQGWPAERVHVVYWGVDDAFLAVLPERQPRASAVTRLLFAGSFDRRKGALELAEALRGLGGSWSLEIAGAVGVNGAAAALLADPRVSYAGTLSRQDLARRMAAADVFVFPSRAEGSARVVFEALAAGCYVITTPNAGSIVDDGIHGRLVAAGDAPALRVAVEDALEAPDVVSAIGRRNAELVRRDYRERTYGDALARVYAAVATERTG